MKAKLKTGEIVKLFGYTEDETEFYYRIDGKLLFSYHDEIEALYPDPQTTEQYENELNEFYDIDDDPTQK